MQTLIETLAFLRRAKECGVSEDEREEMVNFIAANPKGGDEMPGTGGARKIRFARQGQGKRGSYRIITFYSGPDIPVFLLTIYTKNEKEDISQDQKNALKSLLKRLPETYRKGEQK